MERSDKLELEAMRKMERFSGYEIKNKTPGAYENEWKDQEAMRMNGKIRRL